MLDLVLDRLVEEARACAIAQRERDDVARTLQTGGEALASLTKAHEQLKRELAHLTLRYKDLADHGHAESQERDKLLKALGELEDAARTFVAHDEARPSRRSPIWHDERRGLRAILQHRITEANRVRNEVDLPF